MSNPQEAKDCYYNIRLRRDGHSATQTDGGDDYKQPRNHECASNVGAEGMVPRWAGGERHPPKAAKDC